MPKLTETTNDKNKKKSATPQIVEIPMGNGQMHIVAAHEPLKTGEMPPIPTFQPTVNYLPQQQTAPQSSPLIMPEPVKIALVGTAPSSRMLAPFDDLTWKIWGCSPGNMNVLRRVDAWFELHMNLMWPEHRHYGEPYIKWLNEQRFPVYMQDQSLVPHARVFPMKELVQTFGRSFFTSSFAWMMAFAIHEGAKEIALYGIDMASRDEYILQRPGFYFFKHMAEQRGIKVSAPNESDIMMPPGLYGYADNKPFARKLHARRVEIKQRLAQMTAERDKLNQNITYLQGADEDIDYTLSIWSGVQDENL